MFARATSGDKPNNRLFSPCSRSKMNGVMDVKGRCSKTECCFKGTMYNISGRYHNSIFTKLRILVLYRHNSNLAHNQ